MTKGLLIRSTSVQHTDFIVDQLQSVFENLSLDILSHPHALGSLKSCKGTGELIPFFYKGSFGVLGLLITGLRKTLINKRYDLVIIPVENMNGTGYENILAMALAICPNRIVFCNKPGEMREMTPKESLSSLLQFVFCIPKALFFTARFLFQWGRAAYLEKKNG